MKEFLLVFGILTILLACCGPAGERGSQGLQGAPGQSIVGPQGEPGIDAMPVTVVPLCPGTPSYPATFIEVGFCIGGKLYGTYSANGGFSTELTPGSYNSNAIGSSCSFTVGPDCEVTN